jgi:hypothetical protein
MLLLYSVQLLLLSLLRNISVICYVITSRVSKWGLLCITSDKSQIGVFVKVSASNIALNVSAGMVSDCFLRFWWRITAVGTRGFKRLSI